MHKFKMVCLDIDGTLLNSRHQITPRTKEVIGRIANEGKIAVILVSARMPQGILFLQKELDIRQPVICYGGALILDGDRTLHQVVMPASQVKEIYGLVKSRRIHMSLYREHVWYVEEMDGWARQESEITGCMPVITDFAPLLEEWEKEGSGPNKVMCMAEPEDTGPLHEEIRDQYSGHLNVHLSKTTYLEIMSSGATKTSAIKFLCEKAGVAKSQVIAIGDNYNDVDMIRFAGLGIAMGNAPEDVKRHALYVTLSNDEDGVGEALRKFCSPQLPD